MVEPPPPVTVLGRLSFVVLEMALFVAEAAATPPWSLVDAARPLFPFAAPAPDDDAAALSFKC